MLTEHDPLDDLNAAHLRRIVYRIALHSASVEMALDSFIETGNIQVPQDREVLDKKTSALIEEAIATTLR